MKISVLGAGAIGTAVAYDLCRRDAVARVQVCEARPGVLRALRAEQAHPKLRTYEADARDLPALGPLLAGSAVVVSCVGPEHNARLAGLALDLGAHFVDLGTPPDLRDEADALDERARATGRWVVSGAGLVPGLVDLLVMRALGDLDAARSIRVLVGDVPTEPTEPFRHRLSHSAEKLIEDYTCPVTIVRDGVAVDVEPLTGVEAVEVRGFGEMEAFYAGSGLDALAGRLAGRVESLEVKALRYPGHAAQMRFLLALGLADTTSLDVRTHLTYRDVLVRRLRQRLGGPHRDAVLVRVEATGTADGQPCTRVLSIVDRFDEATGLSAMQRCTAFPAAAVASLLGSGTVQGGGVAPPDEAVDPSPVFEDLAERGIRVEERWEDEPTVLAA